MTPAIGQYWKSPEGITVRISLEYGDCMLQLDSVDDDVDFRHLPAAAAELIAPSWIYLGDVWLPEKP